MVRTVIPFSAERAPERAPIEPEALKAAEAVCESLEHEMVDTAHRDTPAEAETRAVWEALGVLDRRDFDLDAPETRRPELWSRREVWVGAASAAAACLVAGLWVWAYGGTQHYQTVAGEQKALALSDGSALTLNTRTLVDVRIQGRKREVHLVEGEALFAVAKTPDKAPFIVQAGPARIKVTGTRFNVRRKDGGTQIDLLEGQVIVTGKPGLPELRLDAGEALSVDRDGFISPIRPADPLIIDLWRKGQIRLFNTRLDEALSEFNRYADVPLVLADPELGALTVDGQFDARETRTFARAVASVHGLQLTEAPDRFVLRRGA